MIIVMKKHIFIACIALAATTAAESQTTFTEGDFTYQVLDGNQLAVAGCSLDKVIANVPETVSHEGTTYTVTAVADNAFAGKYLPAIGLPKTITVISSGAFESCSSTTYIQIPAGVTSIGQRAFSNCPSLGHLDLPAGLTQLANGSFSQCDGLYTLGNNKLQGITAIETNTFFGCRRLLELPLETPLTSIGDAAFYDCSSLREIPLSSEITNIGTSAFTYCSQLTGINLSQYRGPIGARAFNGCSSLQSLTLPADNPYCHVAGGGKAIVGSDEEVITVLPSLTELTINYPATGENGVMNEHFNELQKLEVPCTWTGSLENLGGMYLRELTIRAPRVMPLYGSFAEDGLQLNVFDYMMEEYESFFKQHYGMAERKTLHAIDLPTSKLYVQEVMPRYPEAQSYQVGNEAVVWTQDFNMLLEEAMPQYFRNEGTAEDLSAYRSYFINRYITEADRFDVYNKWHGEVLRCIDGTVRLTDRFDVNDYFNWYAHNDTTLAGTYYLLDRGVITAADPDASGNPMWLLENGDDSPYIDYALNLLAGVPYNIYILFPGRHPLATEENPCNNRISCRVFYNDGSTTSAGKTSLARTNKVDATIEYNGEPQKVLAAENFTVAGDYGNTLSITSSAKRTELRNGFTHTIALIGILVEPLTDLEWLTTGVQEPDAKATVVERYDLSGRRITQPQRGINLLRMSDGTTRKVLIL